VPLSWNEIKTRAATKVAVFEDKVRLYSGVSRQARQQGLFGDTEAGHSGYIDLLWKGHILIEMKSPGKDLEKAYEQAKNYARALDKKDFPKAATAPIRPALRTYISFIALQASSTVFRSRISNLRGSAC
jgi:hypothetical protein